MISTRQLVRTMRRGQQGSAALTLLFLMLLGLTSLLALASVSQTQVRLTQRGVGRLTGLTLAEAGVDDAINQLRQDASFTGGSGTLYQDPPANQKLFGTFRTTVATVDASTRKVDSVGTYWNGQTRRVVVLVDVGQRQLGFGAMVSDGAITVSGTADVYTTPLNQHVADVISNGNITMNGSSSVDGALNAAGTASGTGYFPSVSNASRMTFPTPAETIAQQNDFATQARVGGIFAAGTLEGPGKTLTGPAYVNGDLTLRNGDSLTVTGGGTRVVYINGDLTLHNGATLTSGVLLVVSGAIRHTGGTFQTVVGSGSSTTPTFISYASDPDAITLNGGAVGTTQGIVYAPNGGVKLNGNARFTGAIVAGTGGIRALGNYQHYYPVNDRSVVSLPGIATVKSWIEL